MRGNELQPEPWRYTQGDLIANVAELRARTDRSAESFTAQLQELLLSVTNEWAIGDLPEECRFLLNTELMLCSLKKEKDPTTKFFDDDEWLRSLTEAQEIWQRSVSHMTKNEGNPKKVGPIKWGSSCGSMSHDDFWRTAKEKSPPSRQRCGSSELDPKAALRLSPSFISSSLTSGLKAHEAASPMSSQAQCGGGVETSQLVSL